MEEARQSVPLAQWHAAVAAARAEGHAFFDWLSAVDRGYDDAHEAGAGLDLVCRLLDVTPGSMRAVLLTTRVPEGAAAPSITDLFPGAAWHERETAEMFGLGFEGFDDGSGMGLRPLLLPDGFEGTPLRKTFQLAARASKTWPGGKEPGEGHGSGAPSRRRVQAPGVPPPEWGPRPG